MAFLIEFSTLLTNIVFFTTINFMFLFFVIRNGFIYEVQTGLTIVTESPAARRGFSCLSKLHQLNGQVDIYVIGKKYA